LGRSRDFIVCAVTGLYSCVLPQALGRSVLFPLFDAENNLDLFIIVLCSVLVLALAVLLSLYLRGAIIGQQCSSQPEGLANNLAPEDLAQLRVESMRHSVEKMGRIYNLSQRELEVLTLYALGYTQKRVATELFISPETVHTHIKNIYVKTNLCSRQKILDFLDKDAC
jgi:DNA-binding NarL/FixJ family response regulator